MIAARRLFRTLLVVQLVFFTSQGLFAQDGSADRSGRWSGLFADTTDVNVVNVEVFVANAKGEPVTGLGKDDFELIVDGEAVAISNFYAVEAGEVLGRDSAPAEAAEAVEELAADPPPPVEDRRLRLVVYVDNINISPRSRKRVFDGVREQIRANSDHDVRYMVVSRDSRLEAPPNVRQSFTDSVDEVLAVLDRIQDEVTNNRLHVQRRQILAEMENIDVDDLNSVGAKVGPGGGPLDLSTGGRGDARDDGSAPSNDDYIRNQLTNQAQATSSRILEYGQEVHMNGRSSIHVVDQLLDQLAALSGRKALLFVSDGLELRPSEGLFDVYEKYFAALMSEIRLNPQAEIDRLDLTPQLNRVLDRASTGRVAFYTLNLGTTASAARGAAEFAGGSSGSLTSSGLSSAEASRRDGLIMMAERTGGRVALARTQLDAALGGLYDDFGNHYSLGFLADPEPGKKRQIKVRVHDKKLRVRHRLSFHERTAQEEMSARVIAALSVLEGDTNPLGIKVRTDAHAAQDNGHFVVPVLVEVPLGKLVLVPGEKNHEAAVSLYVAARDDKGRTSEVTRHACPVRIPNAEILTAMGKSMVCGVRLMMRKGPQEVAVVVRDDIAGNASTTKVGLDVGSRPMPQDQIIRPGTPAEPTGGGQ